MLESLTSSLRHYADSKESSIKFLGIIIAIFGILCAFLARYIPNSTGQVILGSAGGFIFFIGSYLIWYKVIPEKMRNITNLREKPLAVRRQYALGIGAVWFFIILILGRILGGPNVGAVTVAVVLAIWRIMSATDEEREELNLDAELWYETKMEEKQKKEEEKEKRKKFKKRKKENYDEDEYEYYDEYEDYEEENKK